MAEFNQLSLDLASLSVHADDDLTLVADVASPLHVSTTYHYETDPSKLISAKERDIISSGAFIYSRFGTPVTQRVEAVLSQIVHGHAVVYASGLSAYTAALAYYNPSHLALADGYHGSHGVAAIFNRLSGLKQIKPYDEALGQGDLFHIESPINPTGESLDIAKAVEFAHSRGAKVIVDSTFAPPPLQDPFEFGVDMVMHSATKYFGGHSDLLAGILVTKDPEVAQQLLKDRAMFGSAPGNMETWLLLRSLRSYKLRVTTQAHNGVKIVEFLSKGLTSGELPVLTKVYHSSLQKEAFVTEQLNRGLYNPTFSIEVKTALIAKSLPSKLKLFHHATSLGGVESLIEWRAMTDKTVPDTLLRLSIGVEDVEDLIADLRQALAASVDLL
ncbi:Cys/Met metabolism PLP-dependent enzyme-domain-containing protein [Limtongia smithiae]|uniref:Cys/Met metabolism PLP-dependent enzyme-domain-containing protein n=1 Tax=Limtongia smithiae TaxID=1125753 RepID=UPI0034CDC435